MDRRSFLKRAPAAAMVAVAAASVPAVVKAAEPVSAPLPETIWVDRKVADVTMTTVVLPDPKRRKRTDRQRIAEDKKNAAQQTLYDRLAMGTPEELAALAQHMGRECVLNSYDIVSYRLTPKAPA